MRRSPSVTTSQANHDLIQGLFAECWYSCIHGGIPYWNKDVGAFVRGALEEFREKAHRILRVGQRSETSVREAGKEKTHGDAARFPRIVMFYLALRGIWFG